LTRRFTRREGAEYVSFWWAEVDEGRRREHMDAVSTAFYKCRGQTSGGIIECWDTDTGLDREGGR